MVEDNELNPQNLTPRSDMQETGENFFEQVANTRGARHVEVVESPDQKSRMEAEAEPSDLSDLKATLNKLFPRFSNPRINRVAQSAMVSRIANDVFLDLMYLTISDIAEMWDEEKDGELDVQEIISMAYFALSIGLDGKGRIDAIQVYSNETESSSKDLQAIGGMMGV
jgi:hypothetical protein